MIKFIPLFFICLSLSGCIGCTYVEPGYVGIKVNMSGSQKGVEDFPLQTGRIWYNPLFETVYEYPTFMQNKSWSQDIGESITVNSKEGAQITMDVAINYTLDPEQVPELFIEFRQPIDTITTGYLRNQVRDSFNKVTGLFTAGEIFGSKKQEILQQVTDDLKTKLKERAFILDSVSIIGSPRGDDRVMHSINAVIEATQKAIEAENKVKQIEAEALQEVAKAKGKAQAILEEANAQAEANQKIAESITPSLIHYRMLEKWDGVAPKVLGESSNLLMQIQE